MSSANPFRTRAWLYAQFDSRLCTWTRFFGAAAVTTIVLIDFLSPATQWFVSALSQQFLAELSASLESHNVEFARRIALGSFVVGDLDAAGVAGEQGAVQRRLDHLLSHDPAAYRVLLREVDAILNGRGCTALMAKCSRASSWYLGVLDQVRPELGGRIRFADQEDRVAIGLALIRQLGRSPPKGLGGWEFAAEGDRPL